MHELLSGAFGEALFSVSPLNVLLRILAAVLLGGAVAWIHSRTTPRGNGSVAMQATLVLLAGLIAMVTQVIGDNVARAFSLVGALSIVRFRTVVRDTRDTAFVIFAVAVGMAVGALAPWAALAGVLVLGATAFLLARREGPGIASGELFLLLIRSNPDWNLEQTAGPIIDRHLGDRRLCFIRTAKQGLSVDHSFTVALREDGSPQELIKILNRMEGVQEIRFQRQGVDEEFTKL
jgi:hypothetical protein